MRRIAFRLAAILVAAAVPGVVFAAPPLYVSPVDRPGPHPVACSNVAQDFSRLQPLETANQYWRGTPRSDGSSRYVTDLLSETGSLTYSYAVPGDQVLFGRFANRAVTDLAIVCYPTTSQNTRADYPLPNGLVVPHMQRGTEAPILPDVPDETGRWPVILFSHGYAGSPIEQEYFNAQLTLASYGWVTVAPFHGDLRWSLLGFEAIFEDGIEAETLWRDYVAMQAIRPTTASAMLDMLTTNPQWNGLLNLVAISGFGISQGGETMMLLGGAALTTTVFQDSKQVTHDARLSSAVGYIPYFGLSWLPAFGRDQEGVDGVTLPFLAIGGTDDNLAQLERIEQGVRRLGGTRSLVAITGLQHDLEPAYPDDIFTWAFVFFESQLNGNVELTATLQRMSGVVGGGEDIRRIDYTAPLPAQGDERIVVEYIYPASGYYFITTDPTEIAGLDSGAVPGWRRTGLTFKALATGSNGGLPACRYFGVFGSVGTHFYSTFENECAILASDPHWSAEGFAFNADPAVADDCPLYRMRVVRVYNNMQGGAVNHRFTTSASEAASLASSGWTIEGGVFCTPP